MLKEKLKLNASVSERVLVSESKNTLVDSSIIGNNNWVGDSILVESKTSRILRWGLFLSVPVLTIITHYYWYNTKVLERPIQFKIRIFDTAENLNLPPPMGEVILMYGMITERRTILENEVLFEGIPANFQGEPARIKCKMTGFCLVDTTILLGEYPLEIPVYRTDEFDVLAGAISDLDGKPLDSVQVSTKCCSTFSNSQGEFSLDIPPLERNTTQWVTFCKPGFKCLRKVKINVEDGFEGHLEKEVKSPL